MKMFCSVFRTIYFFNGVFTKIFYTHHTFCGVYWGCLALVHITRMSTSTIVVRRPYYIPAMVRCIRVTMLNNESGGRITPLLSLPPPHSVLIPFKTKSVHPTIRVTNVKLLHQPHPLPFRQLYLWRARRYIYFTYTTSSSSHKEAKQSPCYCEVVKKLKKQWTINNHNIIHKL